MERQPVVTSLHEIVRRLLKLSNTDLPDLGIGKGQLYALYIILNKPGLSQKELSELLVIDKSTTAKAMLKLINAGYVYKNRCEKDNRVYHLYPARKAEIVHTEIKRLIDYQKEVLLRGFAGQEIESLISSLIRMRDNVNSEIEIREK